jgi:hypothetical protein
MDYAAVYGEIHKNPKRFPGHSIRPYVAQIAKLVDRHQPERLLDFGCGKAKCYTEDRVHDQWGGLMPVLYDVGLPEFAAKPEGLFGGVICTDVLEHIERDDLPAILDELIGYTDDGGFLFLVIACRPANKKLPDGRNMHVTIEPPEWWGKMLDEALAERAHTIDVLVEYDLGAPPHFPQA